MMESGKEDTLHGVKEVSPDTISTWFYEGNRCVLPLLERKSLLIFSLDGCIRSACIELMLNRWFDRSILSAICANAVFLALDDPLSDNFDELFSVAEVVFNSFFLLEFCIKIVALGAWGGPSGYFRDPWNRLDFAVLLLGWMSWTMDFLSTAEVGNYSFIRALRILKVLRTVNSVPGLKRLVRAILDVIPRLVGTGYLLLFIIFLFGIIGTQTYMGLLRNRCFPDDVRNSYGMHYDAEDKLCSLESGRGRQCHGDTPKCSLTYPGTNDANPNIHRFEHFDNILNAMLSLLVTLSLEGWTGLMYGLFDSWGVFSVTYFVIVILLGSYVALNLLIAVLYLTYVETVEDRVDDDINDDDVVDKSEVTHRRSRSESMNISVDNISGDNTTRQGRRGSGGSLMSSVAEHSEWPSLVQYLHDFGITCHSLYSFLQHNPKYMKMRDILTGVVNSGSFNLFIVCVILFNILALAIEADSSANEVHYFLYISNIVCTAIFTMELVVRTVAANIPTFLYEKFNLLDTAIVAISIAELALKTNSIVSLLRALRALRTFKLLNRWKSLQLLVNAVLRSGPGLGYFAIILVLFIFVFALAGRSIFAGKLDDPEFQYGTPRANFDTFFDSCLTTFQMVTGKSWNDILFRSMEYNPVVGCTFMVILYIAGNVILLKLFLAILLENFSEGRFKTGKTSYYDYLEHDADMEVMQSGLYTSVVVLITGCTQRMWRSCSDRGRNFLPETWSPYGIDDESDDDTPTPLDNDSDGKPINFMCSRDLSSIKELLMDLPVADHYRGKRVFIDCFTGAELLGYLVARGAALTSDIALELAGEILEDQLISPVYMMEDDVDIFRDDKVLHSGARSFRESNSWKYTADMNFEFRGDQSLYRLNGQSEQVSEWLLLSKDAEYKISQIKNKEKRRQMRRFLAGHACGILGPNNKLRIICAEIVLHKWFECAIICLIVASSILLAVDNPAAPRGTTISLTLYYADIGFTLAFSVEMIIKMIAMGIMYTPNAYFTSSWNILDFTIVVVSILSLSLSSLDLSFLKSLRAVRAVRPLRLLSRAPGMRVAINAIVMVIPSLLNFCSVVSVFLLTFAILGSSLFKNKLNYCHATGSWPSEDNSSYEDEYRYMLDKEECHGSVTNSGGYTANLSWIPADSNFDTIGNALITLFELTTMENWNRIMYPTLDIPSSSNAAPVMDHSKYNALFFVCFIIVGAFFIGNLFVGIIVHKFEKARVLDKRSVFMTDEQSNWLNGMKVVLAARPQKTSPIPSETNLWGIQRSIYMIVCNPYFCGTIDAVIVLNMLVMSLYHFGQSNHFSSFLFACEVLFVNVYGVELILRYIALNDMYAFWKAPWNIFDIVILVGGVLDISGTSRGVNITVLRVLRCGRLLKLIRRSKHIYVPLKTLFYSLPALFNIGSLLLLAFFIFAVVGVNLFHDADRDGIWLTQYNNFENFGSAMVLLFRCLTNENWNSIMHVYVRQGFSFAPPFFAGFLLCCNFTMVNLFIAVILENFETALNGERKVQVQSTEMFVDAWAAINDELLGSDTDTLPAYALVKLLHMLPYPLGILGTSEADLSLGNPTDRVLYRAFIISLLRSLNLKVDSSNRVYFVDAISAISQRANEESSETIFENMSSHQRLELLYNMRKHCHNKTMTKVETKCKGQVFTAIDLTTEFNCAATIQAVWRGALLRKRIRDYKTDDTSALADGVQNKQNADRSSPVVAMQAIKTPRMLVKSTLTRVFRHPSNSQSSGDEGCTNNALPEVCSPKSNGWKKVFFPLDKPNAGTMREASPVFWPLPSGGAELEMVQPSVDDDGIGVETRATTIFNSARVI